ncbi:MAG: hypothetical protein HZA54_05855 [Planctomycetes bacterium]|nr:hypothetical protein [Planctomycetota bacterium]
MPARIDELRARAGLLREAVQMIPNPAAPRPSGQAVSMPEEIPAGELPRRIEEEAKRAEVAEAGRREIETAISALNQESARERERDAATEIRVAELRRRAADLEREAARLRSGQVVEFLPGERDALQPILIECSRNGFRACFYGAEGAAQEFADADAVTVESARQGLMEWLQGRNSSAESIVLFLKPSAAGFARELIDDLKASGWMLGFEAMEEDKSILLAPRRKG